MTNRLTGKNQEKKIFKRATGKSLLRGATVVLLLMPLMVWAGPGNIAPEATVTASSELSPQFAAAHITDGVIGVDSSGEWACEGQTTDWGYIRFPWVQLTWKEARWINKVVLYDRPSPAEHVAGGRLVFSDGSRLYVDQIPNDGTGKAVSFPARHVTWVKWEVTDGTGKDLGLSELEVYPAPASYTDYVSWVDPYIETNRGRYFFFVTGGRPFGMVGAAPHTRNKNQNGGGYNYNEQNILGFGQIHDWMISGLEVMPTPAAVDPRGGEEAWKSAFQHDDEIVQPGYQRVYLQSHHVWTELTATDRVSFYRFTWTKTMRAQLLVNLGGYLANSTMEDAVVTRTGPAELSGSFSSAKRYWGGPRDVKVFFVVQFDRPFDGLDGWKEGQMLEDIDSVAGNGAGASAQYKVKAGDVVQMKVAISFTSIENARVNLEKECRGWDFSAVRKASQDVWNAWLGKIAVAGGSEAQKAKFYTDLWHVLLGRHKINDINGYYPDRTTGRREGNFTDAIFRIRQLPLKADGTPKFSMYNSDAFWLSQWNLNVLWGLGWPEVQDEMSASLLQYADNGYFLPRGPSGGGYSYIMTSCPAVSLVVSTYMKGLLTKADPEHAFKLVRQNLMPGGMLGAADDVRFYTRHGWWPGNAGITIEAAFQDWGAAQMAKKLGLKKDYRYFTRRSAGWQTCFDTSVGLLMPRGADGEFFQQDPLSGKGWVEANAWQGSWGVSHDLPTLAALMGGNDSFCRRLNFAFEQAKPSDFVFAYNDGYISYANQPGCSNAHVFSYAGKPWLTQYWVRQVQQQAYSGTSPDEGYGGHDEDQGQMGGVSALMAIGLFNVVGNESTNPVYEITSPIFDEIKISLDSRYYSGKEFIIRTHDNSAQNCYIQKATLNGKPLSTFWFSHEQLAKGGTLELWMGDQANKDWGTGALPPQ